jgi:hypothetical protein
MEKQIQITVTDTSVLPERIADYCKQFGFIITDNNNGILKFKQNSSLLDAWKTNPLKWGSEIIVTIIDNKVLANFYVDTDAQMNTKEQESVWQTFIYNFEQYLTTGNFSNEKLESKILHNKKSRISYVRWAIFGAVIGGLVSLLYKKWVDGNSSISFVFIPVFATLFLGWRRNWGKMKNG